MKNYLYTICTIVLVACMSVFASCSDDDDTPSSVLELSAHSIELTNFENKGVISVEGTGWWIERVEAAGVVTDFSDAERETLRTGKELVKDCHLLAVACKDNQVTLEVDIDKALADENGYAFNFTVLFTNGKVTQELQGSYGILTGPSSDDAIQLSTDNVHFAQQGGSVSLTAVNAPSYFSRITFGDGTAYEWKDLVEEDEEVVMGKIDKKVEWLRIVLDGQNITLTADPNATGKQRSFDITFTRLMGIYAHLSGTQD